MLWLRLQPLRRFGAIAICCLPPPNTSVPLHLPLKGGKQEKETGRKGGGAERRLKEKRGAGRGTGTSKGQAA